MAPKKSSKKLSRKAMKSAKGGAGQVYLVTNESGERVALKVVPLDTRLGEREKRVIDQVRRLEHPHLLRIHDAVTIGNDLYVEMELADGGSVQQAARAQLPAPDQARAWTLQAAQALTKYEVKCLVIACNTASSVGLQAIRQRIEDVPVIGVIEPGAQAACAASRSGIIAVIATEGTVRGGAYQQAILRRRPDARVHAEPAPLFKDGRPRPDLQRH